MCERRTNDLRTPTLHDVQAVRVQAREADQLRDSLDEHGYDGECDAADSLLHAPAVEDHASWNDTSEGDQAAPEPVFGDPSSLLHNVLLDVVVRPAPAEEGTKQVSATGSDVEQTGLDGAREVEPRIQHVADRGQQAVHVPHQGGARHAHGDQVRVLVQADDAQRVRPVPHLGHLLAAWEPAKLDGSLVVDGLREEEEDQDASETGEGRLQPEDVAPGAESDDDAANEGSEGGTDEGARHEPAECRCAFGLVIFILCQSYGRSEMRR